jgi:hypothetical protein
MVMFGAQPLQTIWYVLYRRSALKLRETMPLQVTAWIPGPLNAMPMPDQQSLKPKNIFAVAVVSSLIVGIQTTRITSIGAWVPTGTLLRGKPISARVL